MKSSRTRSNSKVLVAAVLALALICVVSSSQLPSVDVSPMLRHISGRGGGGNTPSTCAEIMACRAYRENVGDYLTAEFGPPEVFVPGESNRNALFGVGRVLSDSFGVVPNNRNIASGVFSPLNNNVALFEFAAFNNEGQLVPVVDGQLTPIIVPVSDDDDGFGPTDIAGVVIGSVFAFVFLLVLLLFLLCARGAGSSSFSDSRVAPVSHVEEPTGPRGALKTQDQNTHVVIQYPDTGLDLDRKIEMPTEAKIEETGRPNLSGVLASRTPSDRDYRVAS